MTMTTGPESGSGQRRSTHARRLSALAVGLVLITASFALDALPAAAATVPGAPRLFAAIGYSDQIRVYFAPPSSDGGSPVTSYRINTQLVCVCIQLPDNHTQTTTATYIDGTVTAGHSYRFTIYASNASGEGAASATLTVPVPTTSSTDFTKFPSIGAFVTRQYEAFLGRAPTPTELSDETTALTLHTGTAASLIGLLAGDASRLGRQQVVRLYFAYFHRPPDHGGLAYWTAQIASHKKNINDVSNNFASSHEFKTTYGTLSNIDFVTLVYHNVLNRDPDPTGLAFWVNQLDQKLVIRGRVMTQFSESNEFRNASRGEVTAADVWDAMLGTAIPSTPLAELGAQVQGGGTAGYTGTYVISLADYVA